MAGLVGIGTSASERSTPDPDTYLRADLGWNRTVLLQVAAALRRSSFFQDKDQLTFGC